MSIIIIDARQQKAANVGVINKKGLKMRSDKQGLFDYCPLCGIKLLDIDRTTRWIHDIMNHRGYFELQMAAVNREQVLETLYEVIEHYYRDDKI